MLKRFTLKKSGNEWTLHDQLGELVRSFKNKAEALQGGTLEKLVDVYKRQAGKSPDAAARLCSLHGPPETHCYVH